MKRYLKQSVFLMLYHPASYLAGMLIAGIVSVILSACLKTTLSTAYSFFDPLMLTVSPLLIFFVFLFFDGYKSEYCSARFVFLSALPCFIVQHICILCGYHGAMAIGSCQVLTATLLPSQKGNSILEVCLVMLGLQLLLHLPTYLFAYSCGHKLRVKRNVKS